jgi:hypothetical protein
MYTDEDNPGMSAVPEDARWLMAKDADAVEVLALRMLHGFVTTNTPAVRDAAASIDQYGGYRHATRVIHDMGSSGPMRCGPPHSFPACSASSTGSYRKRRKQRPGWRICRSS